MRNRLGYRYGNLNAWLRDDPSGGHDDGWGKGQGTSLRDLDHRGRTRNLDGFGEGSWNQHLGIDLRQSRRRNVCKRQIDTARF